jgi:oxygen-dependent protoporphyrinogen oxidase
MEQSRGSIIRALRAAARSAPQQHSGTAGARYGLFLSLRHGMQSLVDRLAQSLPAGSLLLKTPVRRIARTDLLSPWRIDLLDGQSLEADAVIVATEAHAAARILEPQDPELSRLLRSIPYASSAILGVALSRDQIAHPLDGFGFVIPAIENRDILAASFSSIKFPDRAPAGKVLIRVFLGGALQPQIYDLDDQALTATALRELSNLLGITGNPDWIELARHPRGMPQYILGHRERVAAIRSQASDHAGLILAGNAFDGVGIPDCIRSGRAAAESAWSLLGGPKRVVAA